VGFGGFRANLERGSDLLAWPALAPESVEGVLADRIVCAPREALRDELDACPSRPTRQQPSAALRLCEPDCDGQADSIDLMPRRDRAATHPPSDPCRSQSLHAKSYDS
jgi:hypothetical protein